VFGFGKTSQEDADPLDAELKRIEEQKRRMHRELQNLEEKLQAPVEEQPQNKRATFAPRQPSNHPTSSEPKEALLKVERKNIRNQVIILLIIVIALLVFVVHEVITNL